MDNSEVNKTSDEIINELFSSLNVPLSPKTVEVEEIIKSEPVSAHPGDSDNSEDDESNSKSSGSEEEMKTMTTMTEGCQEGDRTEKVEKQKSQKKKKDKKKKKKKHRKREDGGRHKHRKKKKKDNFETAEEATLAADIMQDIKVKNQAFIQKVINQNEVIQETLDSKEHEKSTSKSESPKFLNTLEEVGSMDKKKPRESQSYLKARSHEEVSASLPQDTTPSRSPLLIDLESIQDRTHVTASKCEENASRSEILPCLTHETSPEPECVSNATQTSHRVTGRHKRKQSPHSCSPSAVKKRKATRSASPSKSSSPTNTGKSRSELVKDSKSESCRRSNSKSPPVKQSKSQSTRSGSKSKRSRSRSKKRSESKKRSRSRKRSTSKSRKNSESKSKRRSRSRSRRRSGSRSRRDVRSRSRKRSRSRSRKRSKSRKRSRSRKRSKSRKRSRSKSRRKSAKRSKSRDSSRSKSKKVSDSKGRKSRSKSRSQSRRRSTSKSEKRSYKRRSRSRSSKRSRSKSLRSRSRRRSSSQSLKRSRSKSSHKSSPAKENIDMFILMRERANRLAELKSQGIPDGSLGSLLLSVSQSSAGSAQAGSCTGAPHAVPASDPSSIPLPQKNVPVCDSQAEDEAPEESSGGVEEEKPSEAMRSHAPAPVAEDSVNPSSQEPESSKAKEGSKIKLEEGNEKGKIKTMITIKSLKDSIVFQQAQEEAERKAKENVDQPAERNETNSEVTTVDSEWQRQQESTEKPQHEANQIKKKSLNEKEKYREDNHKKSKAEKREERKQGHEKQRKESHSKEMHGETENDMKKTIEKEAKEREKSIPNEAMKQVSPEETAIETKSPSRNEAMDKTKVTEEGKESTHTRKVEEGEGTAGNKPSSEAEENKEKDKNELSNIIENNDKEERSREDSKRGETEDKKTESCKSDEVDSRKNKQVNKVEENECKGNKHCSKVEEEEEEESESALCSIRDTEEIIRNKQSSQVKEKEDEDWTKQSMVEEKSKGNKSSTPTEEKEEGKSKRQSSHSEDEEESGARRPEGDKNGHPQPEQDSTDKMEEGEIVSDKEETVSKPSSKPHSKKSKKDKSSAKEKKRSHKDKSKNKEEKKKAHEKKKEKNEARSRSKDRHRSKQHSSSGSKDYSHSRRYRKHSRSRSHSRDRSSRQRNRSHSRSRSKSRSKRRRESTSDLRDKVTRKRLLEIARRNAVYLMENGCLPPCVEKEQLVKIKAGGKSVDELTDFCKQLVASGNYSDDGSDASTTSEEDNSSEKPFSSARHPFSVRDSKPILMNIRNAPMLPTKTNAERLAGQAKLREQFPVSSGSQHRTKESEWVPVAIKEKKEEDKVFTKPEASSVDISQIVSTRLSAMRKLQDNPNDSEAIKTLNNVQKEMQNWALSKQEPGQFTGTTGVKVLSQEELSSGHQAWARKCTRVPTTDNSGAYDVAWQRLGREQFKEAAPVRPHFGLKMLQKMGWSPGEGLGKNKEGTTEPLLLDVKMDKKGFHAQEEVTPKKQPIPLVKDLSGKHPVSALVEFCSKRKWLPPDFEMVFDCGPDHKKNFLMKVLVNGQEFKPSVAASTKKMAKANAAAAYLQSLGVYPKDPRIPL